MSDVYIVVFSNLLQIYEYQHLKSVSCPVIDRGFLTIFKSRSEASSLIL